MIKIGLGTDDFYMNGELMDAAGGIVKNNVICEVSEEWYAANKDSLPTHDEMKNVGGNVKIINCNL